MSDDVETVTAILMEFAADDMTGDEWRQLVAALAEALAAEREKARAPFLALADELAHYRATENDSDWEHGNVDALNRIAALIRQAAAQ